MIKLTKEQFLERYRNKFNIEYTHELPNNFSGNSFISTHCDKHLKSKRSANDILNSKFTCKECGNISRATSNRNNNRKIKIPFEDHVTRFKNIHGDCYEYPAQTIKNSHDKINVICKKHGEFYIHIHSHLKGVGCPHCRNEEQHDKQNKRRIKEENRLNQGKLNRINANKARSINPADVELLCREKHGDKFHYAWEDYSGKSGRFTVICDKHGATRQSINEHLKSKYGCPYCANYSTSFAEKNWLEKFSLLEKQKKIILRGSFVKVDGYDRESNTVYEYLGDYWHGHPRYWGRYGGINLRNKKTFEELFLQTELRLIDILNEGYNIIYRWDSDSTTREFKGKLEW